jgi:hypothetical protein
LLWLSAWPKRIAAEAIGEYREHWPTWARSGTQYDPEHPEKARDRAIPRAGAEDDMERVPPNTLEADCSQRLLRDGSVEASVLEGIPFRLVIHSMLYESVGSTRGHSENQEPNRSTVNDSDYLQDGG